MNESTSPEAPVEAGPGVLSTRTVGVRSIATTTVLTSRNLMAYAAAINDSNGRYYDDTLPGGVRAHPGFSFRLQWCSRFRPDQQLNERAAAYGVHAETDLRLYRPFVVGDAITTQGVVVAMRQLPPGVFTLDRYQMRDSAGQLVAELDYNGITRGASLAEPVAALAEEPKPPLTAFPELSSTSLWQQDHFVSPYAAQQYSECAQIYNPIHTEPSVAKAAGLPGIILHGSATQAIALSAVIDREFGGDARCVTRVYGQLRAMVFPDSFIHIECLARKSMVGDGIAVAYQVRNAQGQLALANGVVEGRAVAA